MTLESLLTILTDTKLPVTYEAWPIGYAPALPWICYRCVDSDNFAADNSVFFPITNVDVELYTETKDPTTEATVEAVLAEHFVYEKSEDYIPDERMYQITYSIQI